MSERGVGADVLQLLYVTAVVYTDICYGYQTSVDDDFHDIDSI